MIFAGVDVGAATAKAVILCDKRVAGYAVIPTGHDVKLAAEQAVIQAMERAGISTPISKLDYVISTGYARNAVAFSNKSTTEIICHARGAHFTFPEVRTIIDIGGQDSKAIELDDEGNVRDFIMNDKCAAGTGRFLEVMAGVLQVGPVDNMGPLSLKSKDPCQISSTCTIFAESEVVSLRAEGRSREDLIAGVHDSIASRVANMSRRLNIKPMLVFTGGVAKNVGVKKSLEVKFGISIAVPEEPQIIGALGAALFAAAAAEQIQKERNSI
jgi:predicted CoA-substrate-specific enzyme activase